MDRRTQLLAIGSELFAHRSFDDVSIEEVAEVASVSPGLLYHYFPSKKAFYAAVVQSETSKLLRASVPDPALPPLERLYATLDVYIAYAAHHPDDFRIAQKSVADAESGSVQRIRADGPYEYILENLANTMTVDAATRVAVAGWLAFLRAAVLSWLDDRSLTSDKLRDVCARALLAAVGLDAPTDDRSRF